MRKEVKNIKDYPYDCLGMILAEYDHEHMKGKVMGTGFLISENEVITAATNCCKRIGHKIHCPKRMVFIPACQPKEEIEVRSPHGYVSNFPYLLNRERAGNNFAYLTLSSPVKAEKYFVLNQDPIEDKINTKVAGVDKSKG